MGLASPPTHTHITSESNTRPRFRVLVAVLSPVFPLALLKYDRATVSTLYTQWSWVFDGRSLFLPRNCRRQACASQPVLSAAGRTWQNCQQHPSPHECLLQLMAQSSGGFFVGSGRSGCPASFRYQIVVPVCEILPVKSALPCGHKTPIVLSPGACLPSCLFALPTLP